MSHGPRLKLTIARVVLALVIAGVLLVVVCTPHLHGQTVRTVPTCDPPSITCLTLVASPDLAAEATVVMLPAESPYGVAVTADGRHRRRLVAHVRGLPSARTLGAYATYVAWSTSLSLDSV